MLVDTGSRSIRQEVNDRTRDLHAQWGTTAGEFLCECGDDDCNAFMWLTLRELDGLRARGTAISAHQAELAVPPTLTPAA